MCQQFTGFECLIGIPDMSLLLAQLGSSAFEVVYIRHMYALKYDPRAAGEVVRMTQAYVSPRLGGGRSTYTSQLIESVFATPSIQA